MLCCVGVLDRKQVIDLIGQNRMSKVVVCCLLDEARETEAIEDGDPRIAARPSQLFPTKHALIL